MLIDFNSIAKIQCPSYHITRDSGRWRISCISNSAVSKWEDGQGNPEIDNVVELTEIYNVSADYILLGRENNIIASEPEKKTMSKEMRIALAIISIMAATALVSVLFIIALGTYAGL